MGQNSIDIFMCQLLIGTAVKKNTVLRLLVDLYDRVACFSFDPADIPTVYTILFAGVQKRLAILADHAAMINLCARFCQCDRLVDTFASQKYIHSLTADRLARLHDMIHTVNIIQIH